MLGIICAMEIEAEAILKHAKDVERKEVCGMEVAVCKLNGVPTAISLAGIGKVNAAISATLLCEEFDIDALINVGIAGGLSDEVNTCDCVVCSRIDQWDYDTTALNDPRGYDVSGKTSYADQKLNAMVLKAVPEAKIGDMVSGDAFVSTDEQRELIKEFFPSAVSCDMEGAAIAAAADKLHKPFTILRTISDKANEVSYEELKLVACNLAAKCVDNLTKEMKG